MDLLIATYQPNPEYQSFVWKRLTDVPDWDSIHSLVVFGKRLVAVGSSVIHAYSPYSQSWIHVGDLPEKSHSIPPAAAILPYGDLLIVTLYGHVYQVSLTGKLLY